MRITSGGYIEAQSPNRTGNNANLRIYSTDTQAANVGASIGLGGSYGAGNVIFGLIKGAKENSTNNDSNGYMSFTVHSSAGEVERMRITSGGQVLIGKTTDNIDAADGVRFDAGGSIFASIVNAESTYFVRDITNTVYRFYVTGAGTINATNTTISAISDVRLKENITDLEIGLDAIMALRPRQFDWKKESGNSGKNIRGFIAQEFEQIFPDLIDESINPSPEGEEPYKQIRQDLIPILVKAMQQQQAQIEELSNKILALQSK